jgi:hypothetical protein
LSQPQPNEAEFQRKLDNDVYFAAAEVEQGSRHHEHGQTSIRHHRGRFGHAGTGLRLLAKNLAAKNLPTFAEAKAGAAKNWNHSG